MVLAGNLWVVHLRLPQPQASKGSKTLGSEKILSQRLFDDFSEILQSEPLRVFAFSFVYFFNFGVGVLWDDWSGG
jgi:hypothetical protein